MTTQFTLNEIIRCVVFRIFPNQHALHLLSKRHIFPVMRTAREFRNLRRHNIKCIHKLIHMLTDLQVTDIDDIIQIVKSQFLSNNEPPPLLRTCTGWLGTLNEVTDQCMLQTFER